MLRFRGALALLVVASTGAALAAPSPAAAQNAPLEFEYLIGSGEVTITQFDCNPSGTSTVTIAATGAAGGPYPGVFEETIVLTGGAQTFGTGELLRADAAFRIVSGDTVITGTKQLIPSQESFYEFYCSSTPAAECDDVSVFAAAPNQALRYEAEIRGPDGTSHDQGNAEFQVSSEGVECAGEQQFSSGYFEEFFALSLPSSEPATVTLSPAADVNPVDTYHTVTATVLDESGQPVRDAVVRFAVTGASSAIGDCRTDANGQCDFTYQVSTFPGEDAIAAYVDVNANAAQDAGEPTGAATKTIVLPISTRGRTTGGGRAVRNQTLNPGELTFAVTARSSESELRGECAVVDQVTGTKVNCLDVIAYVQHGNQATIYGHGTVDGVGTLYRIYVIDNGEGGTPGDYFTIQTASGYVAGGPLTDGNLQVR
jgi:hypothetical protein